MFHLLFIASFRLFSNLSTLFPAVQPLVHVLKENRDLWEVSKTIFEKYTKTGIKGIDILLDLTFEQEVLRVYSQSNNDLPGNSMVESELNETKSNVQNEDTNT